MYLVRKCMKALTSAVLLCGSLAASAGADLMLFAFDNWARAGEPAERQEAPAVPARPRQEVRDIARRIDHAFGQLAKGRYQEAQAGFRHVLGLDPANLRARFGLGNVMIQTGQYAEARDIFERLVEENPKDYSLKNNLAWLYATAKDHGIRNGLRALELAQQALMEAPTDHHVWSTLAESYYILGQYTRAQRSAQIAFDLAQPRKGTERNVEEYRRQLEKCRRAAEAMSILE